MEKTTFIQTALLEVWVRQMGYKSLSDIVSVAVAYQLKNIITHETALLKSQKL